TFRFGYVEPPVVSRTGPQYLGYNHFFPSVNPAQSDNLVTGFVQINNTEGSEQSGEVIFFGEDGNVIKQVGVTVPANGRVDIDTHTIGRDRVGLVQWKPDANDKKFRVTLKRYYCNGTTYSSGLAAASSIAAKRGSGYPRSIG